MISRQVLENLKNSSWIRAMFEEGNKLKAVYGDENVYDFSIGNPEVEPPQEVADSLMLIAEDKTPGTHRYMPNSGYPFVKDAIAKKLSDRYGLQGDGYRLIINTGLHAGQTVFHIHLHLKSFT